MLQRDEHVLYALLDCWLLSVCALRLCPITIAHQVGAGRLPVSSIITPMLLAYHKNVFLKRSTRGSDDFADRFSRKCYFLMQAWCNLMNETYPGTGSYHCLSSHRLAAEIKAYYSEFMS